MTLSFELETLINNYKFLFKNLNWLMFPHLNETFFRNLRMYPAAENILSNGVDMAGIARYRIVRIFRGTIFSRISQQNLLS